MMRGMPSPNRPSRFVVLASLFALAVIGAACSATGGDEDGEDAAQRTTTSVVGPDQPTTSTLETTTLTIPAVVEDLSDVAWVVNDFDGLIDDRGRELMTVDEPPIGGSLTVARAGDGSIWFVADGSLWHWPLDADRPLEVEVETDQVANIGYVDGDIVVDRYGEAEVVADVGDRQRPDAQLQTETGEFITAANGITVRVLDADADVDDRGYVSNLRSPARLQVERNEEIDWTIDAGGVDAPWLSLIDFDGRRVMMARFPTEPADPVVQHIVYDLNCRPEPDSVAGRGCTRTFWARYGTATLVGPDVEGDDLNTQLLDVCPTMRVDILPPTEMTDIQAFTLGGEAPGFTTADRAAFEQAVLRLATCDPLGIGPPSDEGLDYDPDLEGSGWLWSDYAAALSGPFTTTGELKWTWNRGDDHPSVMLTGAAASGFGEPLIDFIPVPDPPVESAAVTVTETAIVLSGAASEEVADRLREAAGALAETRGVELTDMLVIDGGSATAVDELTAELAATFGDAGTGDQPVIGEAHLIDTGVVTTVYGGNQPTLTDRDLGFAFVDFANGGEGAFDDLRFADEVLLALGSEVYARRDPAVLFRRPTWTVNAPYFEDYSGPFNLLDGVPSPSEIVVGPHRRCAGPLSIPAPTELARHRRVAILPAEGSIESCMAWASVDVFVDAQGRIHGVALDLFGP